MIKISILFFFFLISSVCCKAQVQYFNFSPQEKDSIMGLAGSEFLKFNKNATIGFGMMVIGSSAALASAASNRSNSPTIITVGAITSAIGFLFVMGSTSHAGKAGYLMKLASGHIVKIPLKKTKKN